VDKKEKPMNWDEVIEAISASCPDTKIYIGCDSQKIARLEKTYYAYSTNVVLHVKGAHGGRFWESIEIEEDYGVMSVRLMNECMKCCEVYERLKSTIGDRYTEIHLDLNEDKSHPSNTVVQQAVGYAVGMTLLPNEQVKIKPQAWASSHVADRACKKTAKNARKRRMLRKKRQSFKRNRQ